MAVGDHIVQHWSLSVIALSYAISVTSVVASHMSILVCYWLTSLGVTKSVKLTEARTRSRQDDRQSQGANPNRLTRGQTAATSMAHSPSRSKIYVSQIEAKTKSTHDVNAS